MEELLFKQIFIKTEADLPKKEGWYYVHKFGDVEDLLIKVKYNPNEAIYKIFWTAVSWYLQPLEPDINTGGEKIVISHQCNIIARACMGEGRDWWCGELIETIPEYPLETHCLHLKTQLKDVVFLCNKADFQQLQLLGRCITGKLDETWIESMLKVVQTNVSKEKIKSEIKRKEKLFDFVVRHKTDCYRAFKRSITHEGFKYSEGGELIKMARTEIGYSEKTWAGDIYNALHNVYKSIVVDGINSPEEIIEQENPATTGYCVAEQTAEEILDIQQYMTNLLYFAHFEAQIMDQKDFDAWVEREIDNIESYFASQKHPITDEEIEEWAESTTISDITRMAKIEGATWLRDRSKTR